jgi:hypothetical protein
LIYLIFIFLLLNHSSSPFSHSPPFFSQKFFILVSFSFGTAGVCKNYPKKFFNGKHPFFLLRAPGSNSPFTNNLWQHHELNPETRFDVVGAFREDEDVKWARKQLRRRQLMPLLQPAHDVFHQRFVRLFYQNMTFDSDKPEVLSSTINGIEFEVTIEDIAEALGCPHECPSPRFTEPLPRLTCTSLCTTCVMESMPTPRKIVQVRQSFLRDFGWLIRC